MTARRRKRHILSIDDAPFDKYREREVWVVGVITAGTNLVEGVLSTRVPVDGDEVTDRLAAWMKRSRFFPSLRAVIFQGITIAGLSVIDLAHLHALVGIPVVSVDRRLPGAGVLEATLRQLGLESRIAAVRAAGRFHSFEGIFFSCAGTTPGAARAILEESRGRSKLPEGIRLAHLIGQAIATGESRGRA